MGSGERFELQCIYGRARTHKVTTGITVLNEANPLPVAPRNEFSGSTPQAGYCDSTANTIRVDVGAEWFRSV